MLSTQAPSHALRTPVHLENISKLASLQSHSTPNGKTNNFVKERAKLSFTGNSGLETIPERPMTTNHTNTHVKTRSTLSRTAQSLNSLTSRKGMKTQASFMDSSIVLDFIADSSQDTNGFQKKAVIRAPRKLKKQFFYNSIYDVRQDQEPLEERIGELEKIYEEKAKDMLWNTPPQQLMRCVLESYARVQPKGVIKQYLNYVQEKNDVKKIQRQNNRPSSSFMKTAQGTMKARTVENFFKEDQGEDKQEIMEILNGPLRYHDITKHVGKDVTESINDYCSTLGNCNALLMSVRDPQSLANFDDLLEETPQKSKQDSNEKAFEKWSDHSENKENEAPNAPKLEINDCSDVKMETSRKVHFLELPGQLDETKPSSRLTKSAINKISTISKGSGSVHSTFYASKTKAIAIIRQRPSTSGSMNSTQRSPFKESILNSLSVKNSNLVLEGRKALPEMLSNPHKFSTPRVPAQTVRPRTSKQEEDDSDSPQTPGKWILEGMTIPKLNQDRKEKEEKEEVFHRKGHIKKVKVKTPKAKNLISLMKRPNSENNAMKRRIEFVPLEESPKDLLNAWASEDNGFPSRITKIEYSFEPQLVQELL